MCHSEMPLQTKVYLGNGCFWARQHAFVKVEQSSAAFGDRTDALVTSLAGYAGSTRVGPRGLVCYHGGPAGTVYEGLGDCEVVQVRHICLVAAQHHHQRRHAQAWTRLIAPALCWGPNPATAHHKD